MPGLLLSQMEPPEGLLEEFHDWYEHEHIPARLALPGFVNATRYEAIEGEPRFLACYFVEDLAALQTPGYRTLKASPGARTERMLASVSGFTRYVAEQLADSGPVREPVGALSVVAFPVAPEHEAEFEAWYEEEHVPMLLAADGWLRVRRYRVLPGCDGPAWTHLALHELRSAGVMDAPERHAARATARRAALARHPWFDRGGRWLYRPIFSRDGDHS